MSLRRNLLLSQIANSYKWLPYSYEYLYYDLIPQTISGKNVKNKARVQTIYGNSEVENQLIDFSTINSQTKNDVVLTNNNDGSFTLSGTASADTTFTFLSGTWEINHYYLIYGLKNNGVNGSVYWYDNYYSQFSSYQDFIYHPTNSSYPQRRITLFIKSGTQVNFTFFPQVIDLTKEYPFDTPTTLTDKRVQNIINRGYIPFNSGEIKSVDMSSLSTTKADTTSLDTIPFKYQGGGVGTSHDRLDRTNTEWVFTKRQAYCDFKSFAYDSNDGVFKKQLTNATTDTHYEDFLHSKYNFVMLTTLTNLVNGDITRANQWFYIKDTSTTNPSDLVGNMLYTLATPQVISIPRKHLGIKRIGEIANWSYDSYNLSFYASLDVVLCTYGQSQPAPNMYCSRFLTKNTYYLRQSGDMVVSTNNTASTPRIYVKDTSCNGDVNTFLSKHSGDIVFYETIDEVADIDFDIDIESGGTITSNSNVLPNADLEVKCK